MAGILRTDTIQNSNTSTIITQTNSTTITIGTSGQTVALASGASSSGFGATYNGAVNWDTTPKTTTVTAASGSGYFINTTSAGVTVNLPAGSAGAIVALSDYAATWNTNAVTVNANGTEKIGGVASAPATLNTQGQAVTLVYVDSTQGWVNVGDATKVAGNSFVSATGGTITTSGDYKIHTFTGPGTFTVTCAGSPGGSNSVDYLVVAGGGGTGAFGSGGGGAGGFRYSNSTFPVSGAPGAPLASATAVPVTATAYPITVGAGGSPGAYPGWLGATNGNPSIFSTITSTGGGRGGNECQPAPLTPGQPGGSGGGASRSPGTAGTGNTPPTSPSQGNSGGDSANSEPYSGGGGGGAMAAGGAGQQPGPRAGGVGGGLPNAFGTSGQSSGGYYYFSGGGGGGSSGPGGSGGPGGLGGGAAGQPGGSNTNGTAGTANTGGGGGGGGGANPTGSNTGAGGAGGSGVVIIRYKYQ